MAAWYEPQVGGYAPRADCVAQIVTDLTSYITTDTSGKKSFNVDGFMALAPTRLAAIPEPPSPFAYNTPDLLRSTDVRPYASALRTTVEGLADANAGDDTDLAALLAALKVKSDAVTAYFDDLFATGIAAILRSSLSTGDLAQNVPDAEEVNPQTTYYIVTFVTDREEESETSPVSNALEVGSKDTVTITRPTVPGGRNISYWRVYRSNSGNRGASFQYSPTANVPDLGVLVATGTFVDSALTANLQEVCPSLTWLEPPANLRGLTGMANGIMAGFFDNTVCFNVAYQFHAWPVEHQKTVEYPIVGLLGVDQTLFVGTRANPYLITGTDPSAMAARKLEANQACVSPRSICLTKYGVVYASPDGLCLCTIPDGNLRVITEGLFTKEEWDQLAPENMIVAESDGVLYISTDAPTGGSWQWEIMALGIQAVLNGNGSWGGSGNFAIVLAPTPHNLGFGGVISSVTDVGIGQAIDMPDNLFHPDGAFTPNRLVSGTLTTMPSMNWNTSTYVLNSGESASQSSSVPKACYYRYNGSTVGQILGFDFLTGVSTLLWQGAHGNDVPAPAFHSAYDSVTNKYGTIATDSANTRDDNITVLPGATLSDASIVTPVLAGWPARFAFYNNVLSVATSPVGNGGGSGTLSLYKYSGTDGSLTETIGGSGINNATAAQYLTCANEHGIFVLDNKTLDITMQRSLYRVTDVWTLLASDITYDNTSGKTTTFWCDGKVLIVGPTGVNVGGAGANNVLYRIYRIAAGTGPWKATGYNTPWTAGQAASGTGWFWGYSGTTPIVVRHGPWIAQNALTEVSETGSSLPPPVETA